MSAISRDQPLSQEASDGLFSIIKAKLVQDAKLHIYHVTDSEMKAEHEAQIVVYCGRLVSIIKELAVGSTSEDLQDPLNVLWKTTLPTRLRPVLQRLGDCLTRRTLPIKQFKAKLGPCSVRAEEAISNLSTTLEAGSTLLESSVLGCDKANKADVNTLSQLDNLEAAQVLDLLYGIECAVGETKVFRQEAIEES